jgi:excisionase family DNA binding protein
MDQINQTPKKVDAMDGSVETPFEPLLSHKEAAELLGINRETLRRMAVRGEVPALKVGRFWKYRASALDSWVSSRLKCSGLSCREKVDL